MSHESPPPSRARFTSLSEATAEDWAIIDRSERDYRQAHGPGRGLLNILANLADHDAQGAPVNLYVHSLQCATRTLEQGEDDELTVVALFHDLAESFSDADHGKLAAQMLSPWLSERRTWLLEHHGEFQNFYFANHPTRNRSARDRYAGHPFFYETEKFCARYDQNSFDPAFTALPLIEFEPIVMRFFSKP